MKPILTDGRADSNDGPAKTPALDADDIAAIKATLLARRDDLRRRVQWEGCDPQGEHEVSDLKEDAARSWESQIETAEQEAELTALRDVDSALQRMALGSYGVCANCDEPIAAARLRANPSALRCTACQAAREQGGG